MRDFVGHSASPPTARLRSADRRRRGCATFPDTDTLEIDSARIRAIARRRPRDAGHRPRALANGDGSEVQLLGGAHVDRRDAGKEEAIEFRGEFLHAFRQHRARALAPAGGRARRARASSRRGMEYDNLARVRRAQGPRRSATFDADRAAPAAP